MRRRSWEWVGAGLSASTGGCCCRPWLGRACRIHRQAGSRLQQDEDVAQAAAWRADWKSRSAGWCWMCSGDCGEADGRGGGRALTDVKFVGFKVSLLSFRNRQECTVSGRKLQIVRTRGMRFSQPRERCREVRLGLQGRVAEAKRCVEKEGGQNHRIHSPRRPNAV